MRRLLRRRTGTRRNERGVTLVEVLVSFFLLFVVTLAVLQLLSLGFAVNQSALIRTDLSYRAQRIVETVRMRRALGIVDTTCCPTATSTSHTLETTGTCFDTVWGPAGAGVMEADAKFGAAYTIDAGNTLTVEVWPLIGGANQFVGASLTKAVKYAQQL